jgi:hypothetical protein
LADDPEVVMSGTLRYVLPLGATLLLAACSDLPLAPTTPIAPTAPAPIPPQLGLFTPVLLPPGADWGLYFVSFNPDRALAAEVIHRPAGVTGRGTFVVPLVGSGKFEITGLVSTYGGYTPWASPTGTVPESAIVTGVATVAGALAPQPIELDLHSNLWPRPDGSYTPPYDTATLYFCTDLTYTTCTVVATFDGELHHEPD